MANTAKSKQTKTQGKGPTKPFTGKDDPRRMEAGPGRTAGFKTWAAELFAWTMEKKVTVNGREKPFIVAGLEKWMSGVLKGSRGPTENFIDMLFTQGMIEKVDSILAGERNNERAFLRYQLRETLFDEQAEVYFCKKKTQIVVCGRRAGKTHEMAADGVSVALSHDAGDVLYLGATHTSVYEIIRPVVVEYLKLLRVPYKELVSEHRIELASGVNIYFSGYHNISDIERLRGHKYRRVYIDEGSICRHLKYMAEEVLSPALADYNGIIKIYGTPPRVKGTYFESLWNDAVVNKQMARFNWDMSVNVHMPEYEKILEKIREEKGFKETDQVYLREYLGRMGVYDEDALVYRMTDVNYYTAESLAAWVKDQPPSDLYFVAGLDFGHTDADAFAVVLGSRKRSECFLVYEYKARGTGLGPLVDGIRAGLEYLKKTFPTIPQGCPIFADMGAGGAKHTDDLRAVYNLPTMPAIKQNKDLGISMLQDDVKGGRLKVKKGGPFDDEARFIVFKRDEATDALTREVDDDIYHGDMSDAVLYARRPLYQAGAVKK